MNYFLIISATLIIFGAQASQEPPPVKIFTIIWEKNGEFSKLKDWETYQNRNEVIECKKNILSNHGSDNDIISYCSILWALTAWHSIYCNKITSDEDSLLKYEQPIANEIKECINNGDCMQGIQKGRNGLCWVVWTSQGKHILNYLFELPRYSSVMRDLWQEIKLRPTQDIIHYADEDTELFLEVVFRALKKDEPNVLSKIELLWCYNFLSTTWMKDLHVKISPKLYKVISKLDCLHKNPQEWLGRRKKGKGGLKKAIERNENTKNNLIKHRPAIAQLLAYPYQNKLLSQQMHSTFVDSNIVTQD